MDAVTRIFDLLPYAKEKYNLHNAVAGKEGSDWIEYSIDEYIEKANNISYGLIQLGIEKGDKIASITNNRPEWNFLDMGVLQAGAIHIPIYPTISDKDYRFILAHAEVKYIFVAGEEMFRRIRHIIPGIPSLKAIYTFKNLYGYQHLNELIELGQSHPKPAELEERKKNITSEDLATIIYTSGTMGQPKGVMLKHSNLISNFKAVSYIPPYGKGHRTLSYLPLCHIYERMMNYMFQYKGIAVYYAESIGKIQENLQEVKPQIMTTVPRLLEKIYDKIILKGRKLKGLKKQLFFWSINVGLKYEINNGNGWFYNLKLAIARQIVFKKWKKALGDNLDIIVSGGAALQIRLNKIFWAAGFRVLEGYGLTETSPVIAVSTLDPGEVMFGTVGPILRGVEAKIADDGEILCKGPNIMMGYHKEDKISQEVIDDDGWLHTGDVGEIIDGKILKITDRKKLIFKTSFGKYIAPQPIENKFKESPFIDSIMVVGENQKFAAALIVPDFNHLKSYCQVKGIEYTTNEEMVKIPRIRKRYQKEVAIYNQYFGDTEKIKKFELIGHEWAVITNELSATLKLRRTHLAKKYRDVIDRIYSTGNGLKV